jgi:N-acetylglucosaminyl-diphospho-decaprenol L-rhamnosyltransferase
MDMPMTITDIKQGATDTATPDMSVVLVCWNNKDYLAPCLDSLYGGELRSSCEVVVVDNGSTDGSQAMLREQYPDILIIQNDHNVGLGKASNQGIEATHGRYVLLLNNDTLVNGPSLDTLVDFLDANPQAGAAGGRLLNPDGSFQGGYADFSSLKEEFLIATRLGELLWPGYPSHLADETVRSVGWLSSACLLIRRKALDQIGLLDEEYFIYGDEADLQYRLHRAGWGVYYLPNVQIVHYGGRSMDRWRRRKMVYRGKMLFYKKNYGPVRAGLLRTMIGVMSLAKLSIWSGVSMLPASRERARKEIRSNLDIVRLCVNLA